MARAWWTTPPASREVRGAEGWRVGMFFGVDDDELPSVVVVVPWSTKQRKRTRPARSSCQGKRSRTMASLPKSPKHEPSKSRVTCESHHSHGVLPALMEANEPARFVVMTPESEWHQTIKTSPPDRVEIISCAAWTEWRNVEQEEILGTKRKQWEVGTGGGLAVVSLSSELPAEVKTSRKVHDGEGLMATRSSASIARGSLQRLTASLRWPCAYSNVLVTMPMRCAA